MNNKINSIIVKPEKGLGDAVFMTGVLNSICNALPEKTLIAKASAKQRIILEGILKENGGILDETKGIKYEPSCEAECELILEGYLNRNQSITGEDYLISQIKVAEAQLRAFFPDIELRKDSQMKVRFDNVQRFEEYVERGRDEVRELKEKYGDKPIVWLATRSKGENRMPQSYRPKINFWDELIELLEERFILYELRGMDEEPISKKIEPQNSERIHLASQAEIIKASSAGIGLDSMVVELAHALGKRKMIVLIGPTHPYAIVRKGSENEMLTIPDIETFKEGGYCRGCSMVGYSSPKSFRQRAKGMKERYSPAFELDITKNCRILNNGEEHYDCWQKVNADKVLEKLNFLIH